MVSNVNLGIFDNLGLVLSGRSLSLWLPVVRIALLCFLSCRNPKGGFGTARETCKLSIHERTGGMPRD